MKKALVTGASEGIGKDIATILASKNYHIIAVSRNEKKLKKNLKHIKNLSIIPLDLSNTNNCYKLYEMTKNENIDILINNAGFGVFGKFLETDLKKEIDMINLNIKSLHILTKLFLKDMKKKNYGYILNVASIGSFFPSPLLSSYYATKSYVLSLTLAIREELKKENINVYIGTFCPATISTNFHKKAGAKNIKGIDSYKASKYAIEKMFKHKAIIIPSYAKFIPLVVNNMPKTLITKVMYKVQNKKQI